MSKYLPPRFEIRFSVGLDWYIRDTCTNNIIASQFDSKEECQAECDKLNLEKGWGI